MFLKVSWQLVTCISVAIQEAFSPNFGVTTDDTSQDTNQLQLKTHFTTTRPVTAKQEVHDEVVMARQMDSTDIMHNLSHRIQHAPIDSHKESTEKPVILGFPSIVVQ